MDILLEKASYYRKKATESIAEVIVKDFINQRVKQAIEKSTKDGGCYTWIPFPNVSVGRDVFWKLFYKTMTGLDFVCECKFSNIHIAW